MPLVLCRDCDHLADRHLTGASGDACFHCGSTRSLVHDALDTLEIAHVDCDAFYASVEKRDDPNLADKPLLIGGTSGRGVVTTACYIARAFGPRSAMPMFKALALCPHAVVLKPDMAKYKAVSHQIRAIFASITDCMEPLSLDEAYLDLTPEHRVFEPSLVPAQALTRAQRQIEREVGITVSVGLAPNKFLAKLASDLDKPRGFAAIGAMEARDFLSGLPVGKIHGVGRATAERMSSMGYELIADLQALSEAELIARFGKFGQRLAEFVNGRDSRRIVAERETKSVSAETTFRHDLRDYAALAEELGRLSVSVAERLARAECSGRTVVLKLKTSDFRILTRNRALSGPTARATVIFEAARGLLSREADGGRSFRLIGVGVSDLSDLSAGDVPDLFGS